MRKGKRVTPCPSARRSLQERRKRIEIGLSGLTGLQTKAGLSFTPASGIPGPHSFWERELVNGSERDEGLPVHEI